LTNAILEIIIIIKILKLFQVLHHSMQCFILTPVKEAKNGHYESIILAYGHILATYIFLATTLKRGDRIYGQ